MPYRKHVDETSDGNDHSIDAVRYAVMDDVLIGGVRGEEAALLTYLLLARL